MNPIILDGKKLSNKIKEELELKIQQNTKKPFRSSKFTTGSRTC